jgi:phosphoribosylformimino-5-aminoimidazole carboxamide ribotide isomerase
MQLIPAIDMKDGRCVRLYQGDFAAQTVYSDNPAEIFDRYLAFGAKRVHLVDLDGAKDGSQRNLPLIQAMVARGAAAIQVGGGLRTLERVCALLDAGVQRAVIGSNAVTHPDEVLAWSKQLGVDKLVLAFDVRIDQKNTPWLTTHGWQKQSSSSLYREAVRRFPQIRWQASGGVSSANDLKALRDCGVAAVISGRALLENKIAIEELQPFLPNASSPA